MQKKGEIPGNFVIMLIIAVVVFVVLVFFLSNKSRESVVAANSCETQGGICSIVCNPENYIILPSECNSIGNMPQKCCLKKRDTPLEIIVVNK